MSLFSSTRRQATDAPKPTLRERLAAATGRSATKVAPPAPVPSPAPAPPASPFDDPATVAWFTAGGLVPFPAAAPQSFVRAETAIRLEAGLLLERARSEFARQYSNKIDASDDLQYRKHLPGRLERSLRIPELEAAAREPMRTEGVDTYDASDTDLVDMAAEVARLDAAIETMLSRKDVREPDRQPEYVRAHVQRTTLLGIIAGTGAEGLAGLRAKARAVMGQSVRCSYDEQCRLAEALADDLLRLRSSAVVGRPDPISAVINESRRLLAAVSAARLLPLDGNEPPAELNDAMDALSEHRRDTLLGTVPQTVAGCLALASYAVEFARSEGVPLSEEEGGADLLELMVECPEGPGAPLPGVLHAGPDPVHAIIAESRRLKQALDTAQDGPDTPAHDVAFSEAHDALHAHLNDAVTKTQPTTAAGCGALARHALELHDAGCGRNDDPVIVLRLIADALAFTH